MGGHHTRTTVFSLALNSPDLAGRTMLNKTSCSPWLENHWLSSKGYWTGCTYMCCCCTGESSPGSCPFHCFQGPILEAYNEALSTLQHSNKLLKRLSYLFWRRSYIYMYVLHSDVHLGGVYMMMLSMNTKTFVFVYIEAVRRLHQYVFTRNSVRYCNH